MNSGHYTSRYTPMLRRYRQLHHVALTLVCLFFTGGCIDRGYHPGLTLESERVRTELGLGLPIAGSIRFSFDEATGTPVDLFLSVHTLEHSWPDGVEVQAVLSCDDTDNCSTPRPRDTGVLEAGLARYELFDLVCPREEDRTGNRAPLMLECALEFDAAGLPSDAFIEWMAMADVMYDRADVPVRASLEASTD